MARRGDYGYDAPYALVAFALLAFASAIVAGVMLSAHESRQAVIFALYTLFFLAHAVSFFYTTRHGKLQVWDEILDDLRLQGNERVLDMGCGRGAVLTAVAARLTSGRAIGIDLWSTRDQSGNASGVTRRNALLEDVADRVAIATGDMRSLPLCDAAFDLVVSSLAIHNIPSGAGRAQAVAEAWRVLRPGGRLAIADIRASARYAAAVRALGARDVARRSLGWRFWYGNPFARTMLVTASKPAA